MESAMESVMEYVLHNLRLHELVAVVRANHEFYLDFVRFLAENGYASVAEFVWETSDTKAAVVITSYLERHSEAILYDGLLRAYPNGIGQMVFPCLAFARCGDPAFAAIAGICARPE